MAESDEKIKLPEWMFWPDWKFEQENRLFALRCAESLRDRIKASEDG